MVKRLMIVAIVLAAVLVVVAPAMAFNGYRGDYTTAATCQACHTTGPGPAVYDKWAQTPHGTNPEAVSASKNLPYGSVCQGCHTANFAPSKAIPTPTATNTATGAVTWQISNGLPPATPAAGVDYAASESVVGCSSCHYGQTAAHAAPQSNMANADICGQCHSRYAYTVDTYSVAPVPYVKIDANGSPVPNPTQTTLIQPQMAFGLATQGDATNNWTPALLSTKLNVPSPGWTPTPTATSAAGVMQYWKSSDGKALPWTFNGHEFSATEYTDWSISKHASALKDLKAFVPNAPQSCLQCHSADYIIAPETAKPTLATAKYGLTCVACHTPHDKGTATGTWSEELSPQLVGDNAANLCVQCHTGQLNGKTAKPGAEVHNTTKEIMDGTGAIGVAPNPGVHKGKCVQCHMPPTNVSRGNVLLGANHTMDIIQPATAADVVPMPISTTTPTPGASPVVNYISMPYSACTTCHSRTGDQDATWLQATIDQRQAAMHAWSDQVTVVLTKWATKWHLKTPEAANIAINKIPMKKWTAGQLNFQKAYTNQEIIASEGSWGIHNWNYSRDVVLTALAQAKSIKK
jgi:hypothetical protein